MELKFLRFVFQVLVESQLVCVIDTQPQAQKYAEDNFKGGSVIILPVPIFEYKSPSTN